MESEKCIVAKCEALIPSDVNYSHINCNDFI
jgi:hypothetical protein